LTPEPRFSVIIPAFRSEATIGACLGSLRAQAYRDFEVIVVDSSPSEETARIVSERFPEVRILRPPARMLPHAARNFGVRSARGAILAFTDPDCVLAPDYLSVVAAAHDDGHPVVGGALRNHGTGWWLDAVHMTKFAWWLPGGTPGSRPDIPTAVASYGRDIWRTAGPLDERFWCGDTLLVKAVARCGVRPWFEPCAVAAHIHTCTLHAFLAERWTRGRDFGSGRPRFERWGRGRTAVQLALLPALPLLMSGRAARFASSSGELLRFLLVSPVVFFGNAFWCGGEAISHARLLIRGEQ
jgi:glycosyltransferase involved in cell wall biosynthesis